MLTATHPNSLWLARLYRGAMTIENDPSLDEQTRATKLTDHMKTDLLESLPV
jgi:hypothetical protein